MKIVTNKLLYIKRKYFLLILIIVLTLLLISCNSDSNQDDSVDLATFTAEELSQYDGQDGRKAYIAVDGIIYDVTDVKPWSGGKHNGFDAGKDLTYEIKNISPHGTSKLRGLTKVGKLEEDN